MKTSVQDVLQVIDVMRSSLTQDAIQVATEEESEYILGAQDTLNAIEGFIRYGIQVIVEEDSE